MAVLSDGATYEYEGAGVTGLGGLYPPKKFLQDLLAAKLIYIQFTPSGWLNDTAFIAEFKPRGLAEVFNSIGECVAK